MFSLSPRRGGLAQLSFPQRGKVASADLPRGGCRMREKAGSKPADGNRRGFSLITLQCAHWRELPPLGEALPSRRRDDHRSSASTFPAQRAAYVRFSFFASQSSRKSTRSSVGIRLPSRSKTKLPKGGIPALSWTRREPSLKTKYPVFTKSRSVSRKTQSSAARSSSVMSPRRQ